MASEREYLPTDFFASDMIASALSAPNLPRDEEDNSLVREIRRQEAMSWADGYFDRRAIEVAPKVSVKRFKYSGKSLTIRDFATFLAPERFFTNKNLLLDSDFSSEM